GGGVRHLAQGDERFRGERGQQHFQRRGRHGDVAEVVRLFTGRRGARGGRAGWRVLGRRLFLGLALRPPALIAADFLFVRHGEGSDDAADARRGSRRIIRALRARGQLLEAPASLICVSVTIVSGKFGFLVSWSWGLPIFRPPWRSAACHATSRTWS